MDVNVINVNQDFGISRIVNSVNVMDIPKLAILKQESVLVAWILLAVTIVIVVLKDTMVTHCLAVKLVVVHADVQTRFPQVIFMLINVFSIHVPMIWYATVKKGIQGHDVMFVLKIISGILKNQAANVNHVIVTTILMLIVLVIVTVKPDNVKIVCMIQQEIIANSVAMDFMEMLLRKVADVSFFYHDYNISF